jgi:hypothetical protein
MVYNCKNTVPGRGKKKLYVYYGGTMLLTNDQKDTRGKRLRIAGIQCPQQNCGV